MTEAHTVLVHSTHTQRREAQTQHVDFCLVLIYQNSACVGTPHCTAVWMASLPKGYRYQNMCRLSEIISFPSGWTHMAWCSVGFTVALRLSIVCHFLPGIHGLVISLPIVFAKQWPTWPQSHSVDGCFYGLTVMPQSAHVTYSLCFSFSFPI